MNILVIDAQGGGIGKQLVTAIKKSFPQATVTAVGSNTIATEAMRKAGADYAATGENAVKVNARRAQIIVGPIGIVIADSLLGEITEAMANEVASSNAKRILIPVNHCDNIVVGINDLSISKLLQDVIEEIKKIMLTHGR